MSIPDYQSLMRPLLAFAADDSEKKISDAINQLAVQLKLTDDERSQLLSSGKQSIFANRVYWAQVYLNKAGAIKRTRRSHFVITDRGKKLLAENPTRIDVQVLKQFPEFSAFKSPILADDSSNSASVGSSVDGLQESDVTPEEAIQQAEAQVVESLKSQLLVQIADLSPSFFESLVVDLVVAMGYGGSRTSVVQKLGKSGDEGIDGVVNEDPLGLGCGLHTSKTIRSRQYNWT
jgi:restriction system protein